MSEQNQETPIEIWNKLSEDGKKLATAIAPGGGMSKPRKIFFNGGIRCAKIKAP